MMGRQDRDQRQLFYEFSLDEMIPTDHLLRRINGFATAILADLHKPPCGSSRSPTSPSIGRGSRGRRWPCATPVRDRGRYPRPPEQGVP